MTAWHAPNRATHTRHARVLNVRVSGHFAGRRLRSEIERCKGCGGVLLSIVQFAVPKGES